MTLCLESQNIWRYFHITILPCHHSQVSYQGAGSREQGAEGQRSRGAEGQRGRGDRYAHASQL
ncbi:hypothetical protein [Chroococcidiopsis sp.]|uniref:hypothetical protein n=1 Tax=Chroococcidiopsis sp. TaxID=3088168 RepID=UPI003F2BE408